MTQLNFCIKCGAKRVRDVKEELEKLLQQETKPTPDSCALCLQTLKKTRKKKTLKSTKNDKMKVQKSLFTGSEESFKPKKQIESDLNATQTENKEDKEEKKVPEKIVVKTEPEDVDVSEKDGSHQENQNVPNIFVKSEDDGSSNESIESEAQNVNTSTDGENVGAGKSGIKTPKTVVSESLKCDFESVVADMDPRVREYVIKSDDSKQQFQCTYCDKKFAYVIQLFRHVQEHPDVGLLDKKAFKCNLCDARFNRRHNLKAHRLMHSDYRPFKCNYPPCTAAFKDKHTLAGHELTHTGVKKHHQCPYCSKAFRKTNQLKTHIMIHDGIRPHMCKFCGLCFTQKQNLRTHERRHTEDKPYRCDVCDQAFYQPSHLKSHMMNHTGERPFVCEICGYTCKGRGYLKQHMKVHRSDKPHKCDKCSFSSKRKENLTRHLTTHSTDRPFQCDYCMQVFKHKDSLMKHQSKFMDSEGNIQEHAKRRPPRWRPAKYNKKPRQKQEKVVKMQPNATIYGSTLMDLSSSVQGSRERHSEGHIFFSNIPHPSYIPGPSSSGLIISPHHAIAQASMVQTSGDIGHDYETVDVSLKSL